MSGPRAIGGYPITGELGRGGAGVVYEARHPKLGYPVALKLLSARGTAGERLRRRFEREVLALARLRGPHVVRVIEAGEHEGAPWLAMNLVEGEDLEQWIARRGPLPLEDALRLARQLCEALEEAHQAGVLHRDVKPANVIRQPDGDFVLTDFGLAKHEQLEESITLSRSGLISGTPGYFAPEQAKGSASATPATDVYLVGATLYAALTGQPPFSCASLIEAVVATREAPPRPPRELRSDLPPALEAVILRCLAKEPEQRYLSAQALGAELAAIELGGGALRPRERGVLIGSALALFALSALTLLVAWTQRQGDEPARAQAPPRASAPAAGSPPPSPTPDARPRAPQSPEELEERIEAWKAAILRPEPFQQELVDELRVLVAACSPARAVQGRLYLVGYLRRRGRYERALQELRSLPAPARGDPADRRLLSELILLDGLGRSEEAFELALQRLAQAEVNSPTPELLRTGLALLYYRWGYLSEAMRLVAAPDLPSAEGMGQSARRPPPLAASAPMVAAALRVRCETELGIKPYSRTLKRLRAPAAQAEPAVLLALAAEARRAKDPARARALTEQAGALVEGGEAADVELALLVERGGGAELAEAIGALCRTRELQRGHLARGRLFASVGDPRWRDELRRVLRRAPGLLRASGELLAKTGLEPWDWPQPSPPSHLFFLKASCQALPLAERARGLRAVFEVLTAREPWGEAKARLSRLSGPPAALARLGFELAHGRDDFAEVDRHFAGLAQADAEGRFEALYALSLLRRGQTRRALERFDALGQRSVRWANFARLQAEVLRLGVVPRQLYAFQLSSLQHADALALLCLRSMHNRSQELGSQQVLKLALTSGRCLLGNGSAAATALGAFSKSNSDGRAAEVYRALASSCSPYPAVLFLEELCYEHLLRRTPREAVLGLGRHVLRVALRKDDATPSCTSRPRSSPPTPPRRAPASRARSSSSLRRCCPPASRTSSRRASARRAPATWRAPASHCPQLPSRAEARRRARDAPSPSARWFAGPRSSGALVWPRLERSPAP